MNAQSKIGARAAIGLGIVGAGYGLLTHAVNPWLLLGILVMAGFIGIIGAADGALMRHSRDASPIDHL